MKNKFEAEEELLNRVSANYTYYEATGYDVLPPAIEALDMVALCLEYENVLDVVTAMLSIPAHLRQKAVRYQLHLTNSAWDHVVSSMADLPPYIVIANYSEVSA